MSFFRDILDQIDGSGELAQAEREALDSLQALAEAKRDQFAAEIKLMLVEAGSGPTDRNLPISSVVKWDGAARAYTSTSAEHLADKVSDAVDSFLIGGADNIVKGVMKLVIGALEIFLGNADSNSSDRKTYFIYCTDFAIYRVDLMAWKREIRATSLRSRVEKASAFCYVISNVDVEKIKWNDFVGSFSFQLDQTPDLTKEEKDAAKARMRSAWNFLKGNDPEATSLESSVNYAALEARYKLPLIIY